MILWYYANRLNRWYKLRLGTVQGGKRSLQQAADKWHQVLAKLHVSLHGSARIPGSELSWHPWNPEYCHTQHSKLHRKDCYSWASSAPSYLRFLIAVSYSATPKIKTTIKLGYRKHFLPSVWLAGLQLILYSCKHSKCSFAAVIWVHLT